MNQRGEKLNRKLVRVGMAVLFSFLTFFIFFPEANDATPGRTLVFHNNTNATLFVLNWTRFLRIYTGPKYQGKNISVIMEKIKIRIPPLSKKSLFNFLDKNKNIINIYPKFVRPKRSYRYRMVYVTGKETRYKELNIFPKDFGLTFMSDAPGVSK